MTEQEMVDILNQTKKSDKYDFSVNAQFKDIMLLNFKKIPTFEKNDLADEYLIRHLNDIVANDNRIRRNIMFTQSSNNDTIAHITLAYADTVRKTGAWDIAIDVANESASEIFDAVYEYYANNPIIMIIDRLNYWAVAYQCTDFAEEYEQLPKHPYVKQQMTKAMQDFRDLLLIIQASSL